MHDHKTVHAAITEWGEAFCNKQLDRLMALYAPDAVVFDAIPPFSSGIEAMGAKVAACFPHFPDGCAIETRDLTVNIGAEMAVAHFLWHFVDLPANHPAGRHWLRSSIVWRAHANGGWLIVHDHCSAPFDPYTEKVVLHPETVDVAAAASNCGGHNPVG